MSRQSEQCLGFGVLGFRQSEQPPCQHSGTATTPSLNRLGLSYVPNNKWAFLLRPSQGMPTCGLFVCLRLVTCLMDPSASEPAQSLWQPVCMQQGQVLHFPPVSRRCKGPPGMHH